MLEILVIVLGLLVIALAILSVVVHQQNDYLEERCVDLEDRIDKLTSYDFKASEIKDVKKPKSYTVDYKDD